MQICFMLDHPGDFDYELSVLPISQSLEVESVHWRETEMKVFLTFLTANSGAYNCKLAYY